LRVWRGPVRSRRSASCRNSRAGSIVWRLGFVSCNAVDFVVPSAAGRATPPCHQVWFSTHPSLLGEADGRPQGGPTWILRRRRRRPCGAWGYSGRWSVPASSALSRNDPGLLGKKDHPVFTAPSGNEADLAPGQLQNPGIGQDSPLPAGRGRDFFDDFRLRRLLWGRLARILGGSIYPSTSGSLLPSVEAAWSTVTAERSSRRRRRGSTKTRSVARSR